METFLKMKKGTPSGMILFLHLGYLIVCNNGKNKRLGNPEVEESQDLRIQDNTLDT